MAIARTTIAATLGSGSFLQTGTFTPPAGAIIVAIVDAVSADGSPFSTITISDDAGLQWYPLIDRSQTATWATQVRVWWAHMGASATTRITCTSGAGVLQILPIYWTGAAAPRNASAFVMSTSIGDGAQSLTLAAAPESTSETVGIIMSAVASSGNVRADPGTNFTEVSDTGQDGWDGLQVQVRGTGYTSTTVGWADTLAAASTDTRSGHNTWLLGFEVPAATANFVPGSQRYAQDTTSGTSISLDVTYAAGESALLSVFYDDYLRTLVSFSDGTNTYTLVGSQASGSDAGLWGVYYCQSPTPGTYTVTSTCSGSAAAINRTVSLLGKYTGLGALQTGADATDLNSTTTVDAGVGAAITPTQAPAYLFSVAMNGYGGKLLPGTAFGHVDSEHTTTYAVYSQIESRTVSTTASVSAAWTDETAGQRLRLFTFAISPAVTNPTINTHPANATANVGGSSPTFTVSATGTGVLHYQWKDDGTNVGTDSASYSPTVTSAMQGAQITCVVTDDNGNTTSNAATLTVAWTVTGTGPRVVPIMGGGPLAAGALSSWVRSVAASGPGTGAVTEAASASDSTSATAVFSVARTEAAAASDATSAAAVFGVAPATEAAAAADSQSAVDLRPATQTEATSAADSQDAPVTRAASVTESAASTDAPSATAVFGVSRTEATAATDASDGSVAGGLSDSVTEATTATDSPSATGVFGLSLSEPTSAASTESATGVFGRAVTEPGSAAATESAVTNLPVSATELASATDATSATGVFGLARVEATTATDVSDGGVSSGLSDGVSEAATATDTPSAIGSFGLTMTEPTSATDSASASALFNKVVPTEAASASDSASAQQVKAVSRDEPTTASDSSSVTGVFGQTIVEPASAATVQSTTSVSGAAVVEPASATETQVASAGIQYVVEAAVATDIAAWLRALVPGSPRVLSIDAEDRTRTIETENRGLGVEVEDRTLTLDAENRGIEP